MAWTGVITNAGAAMLATYAQGGHTMTIDSAVVGSGNTAAEDMRTATALAAQEDTAAITGTSAQGANVQIRVQVSASADGGYSAKELGLYAHVDNGTSQLMALYQDPTGVSVPDITVNPDYAFGLYIAIAISNTDDLTVEVDTSATVSIGELTDALALKVDKTVYEAAIAALVSKSGDTMTGPLIIRGSTNRLVRRLGVPSGSNYTGPFIEILDNNDKTVGTIAFKTNDNRISFRQNPTDNLDVQMVYSLPIPPSGQTANQNYDILTTQAPVKVSEGGTGATTKSGSRKNLGIEIQRGSQNVGSSMTASVTFSEEFTAIPTVIATGNLNGNVWVSDITRTGCTIKSSVASNQVRWLAIYIS